MLTKSYAISSALSRGKMSYIIHPNLTSHVCASVPNFLILEWQIYFHTNPMFKEIVDFDGEMIVDGHIPLSEKPGIGVEINEEGMRQYAQEGVPFFE